MKKKIEKYISEFRKEAVRLALQTEQPKAVIADELGINRNTLYTWIQKAMQGRVDLPKTKKQNIILLDIKTLKRRIEFCELK